jgi:hypothetical protein
MIEAHICAPDHYDDIAAQARADWFAMLSASPVVPVGSGEAVAGATCQDCGGHIEGWICQSCAREFRENDAGNLVFEGQPVVVKPSAIRIEAADTLERQAAEIERLREALGRIERWFGEFPETGRFWPNEDPTESARPMSYSAVWGSNGERDFMRAVARAALTGEDHD